jgi:hypothetical protein
VLVFDTRELRLTVRETRADLVNHDLEPEADIVELAVAELANDAEIEYVGLAVQVWKPDPDPLAVPL